MARQLSFHIDRVALQEKLRGQFSHLDLKDPSGWPTLPRYALFSGVTLVFFVVLWMLWLSSAFEALSQAQANEVKLRQEYTTKLGRAVNLGVLKKQREQVQQYVTQLEKQLPGKAEMDALLSDINQAGLGRSLQFELFRPGQVAVRDYYAELPITLRVTGRYHDMGAFASDIANLSRIVTLNNLVIMPAKDGTLAMDATAKTFRYLDPEEVLVQRKAAGPKGAKK